MNHRMLPMQINLGVNLPPMDKQVHLVEPLPDLNAEFTRRKSMKQEK